MSNINEFSELLQKIIDDNNRPKVNFTFDTDDFDVKVIVNRHKIIDALYNLNNYRRELYKYGDSENEIIIDIKNNTIINKEDEIINMEEIQNRKSYISTQSVIDKIDFILEDLYSLLNEY